MSFKYSRLFASTCLSVAAVSLLIAPNANAGFDWVPPEKQKPAEVIQPTLPVPDVVPVPAEAPAEVIEEAVDLEASQEPEITIKVLDETPEEVAEDVEEEIIEVVETIEETQPVVEDDIIVEVIEEDVEIEETHSQEDVTEAIEEVTAPVEEIIEIPSEPESQPVITEMPIETEEEVAVEASANDDSLQLDFNPGTDANADAQPVAILPEDSEQDISEVAIPNAAPIERPEEDIYWAKKENFDVIEGFGNDMPLALALRQIVPARYAFNFGEGVNAGTKVSWEGGKPWNDVLDAALAPIGVDFTVKRSTLIALDVSDEPVEQAAVETTAEATLVADEDLALESEKLAEDEQDAVVIEVPYASEEEEEASSSVVEVVEEIEDVVEDTVEEVAEEASADVPAIVEDNSSPLDEIYGDVNKLEDDVLNSDVSDFPDVPSSEEQQIDETSAPLLEQKKN